MRINKLKKNIIFSLITLIFCCVLLYSVDNILNITGFVNSKIEIIKEKEMKFMYGERNELGDKYSESFERYNVTNVNYQRPQISGIDYKPLGSTLLQNQYIYGNTSWNDYFASIAQYQETDSNLKKQIETDSYRNKNLDFYYVFDYDYTMAALKELSPVIEKIAEAQKIPKALVSAVLFREMMFMGQEDLLDGLSFIGGKSMGICQIGVENVRYNEQTVHGKKSIIANKTDEEIKEMLQNPEHAVYFCAVQLRARAIKQTGDNKVNLNRLNKDQLENILEEYNQSKISLTIGPIKTKEKYAEETYKYYELFSKSHD